MNTVPSEVWPQGRSVLWTSFWGWDPEHWGTVSFTDEGRRRNLVAQLDDPFITVVYVTKDHSDPDLRGRIAGFYMTSHETGDRNDFIDPIYRLNDPNSWRHGLRAIRAFTYLPEARLRVDELDPTLKSEGRARSLSRHGEIIKSRDMIDRLRAIPCKEAYVYHSPVSLAKVDHNSAYGSVRGGPASEDGYIVPNGSVNIPRQLYILRLNGDTSAFLGEDAVEHEIYKIGLSASPELRRQELQKHLPRGAFTWSIFRTTGADGDSPYPNFKVALIGEDAMKSYLAEHAQWLDGEFYLATRELIQRAWASGRKAAREAMS